MSIVPGLRQPVPRLDLRRPWTLRAKLVTSVVVLFLLITAATGALTVLALKSSLTGQLDGDLAELAQRGGNGPDLVFRGQDPPSSDRNGTGRGDDGPGAVPGGGSRTLRVVLNGDGSTRSSVAVNASNEFVALTDAQIDLLTGGALGSRPKTVDVGADIGTYRLVAHRSANDFTIISGLPTSGVESATNLVTLIVLISTGVGLVLVAAGGTVLVRRSLEPLDRVAATATRVSRLPLDTGVVALAERVPAGDTDPRTEVGQVGLALNEMLDHINDALTARHESETRVRQFVADASHELRTPLASIRGYAELSRREPDPVPPGVVHALSRVESEAMRMAELVDDLLLLARLDAGRPLEREAVDLSMLVIDAVDDARAAAPDHQWRLDLPADAVEVTGDSSRLHQVVANLLANARTHTPEGTTVTTTVQRDGSVVRVSVHDDGPGVPESLQRNVFQRFSRGDDSRSRAAGSTGLGLSIVAAVTDAHGGRVALQSRPGDTTFSVILPA